MASLTSILSLINLATGESSYGSFANWGAVADENLRLLELAAGEVVSKAVTSADVSLSDDEHNSLLIKASGALTGNRAIETKDRKGFWFVTNACTGEYTLTFKTDSGTGVIVPQGGAALLVSDGTNVLSVATFRANGAGARIKHSSKSGAYTALPTDDGTFFEFTATATLAFKPAALLGDQWACLVKAGSGVTLTLDPDGSEQINGAATLALGAGFSAIVVCTGTAFRAIIMGTGEVTQSGAETLSNKKMVDASTTVVGSGDATKAARFEVDGIAAGATRVQTVQDKDGTLAHTADITGNTEEYIPAGLWLPALTNGAQTGIRELATNDIPLLYHAFDTTTAEAIFFIWYPPKRWNLGTITFQPYWTAEGGTGTVEFELSGRAASNDDALDQAMGTAQPSADTLIAANDLHIGPVSAAITIAGTPADGDAIILKITRDVANDTLAQDAQFLGAKIFYTTDQGNDA